MKYIQTQGVITYLADYDDLIPVAVVVVVGALVIG